MEHRKTVKSLVSVKHCAQCKNDTEYYCHDCRQDLCLPCKERHMEATVHHVTYYREKFKYIPKQDVCVLHPDRHYIKYCESCRVLACDCCSEHKSRKSLFSACFLRGQSRHKLLSIRSAYETKRQQSQNIINNIRSQTLYNIRNHELQAGLKSDVKTCRRKINRCLSRMMTMGLRLKELMDSVLHEYLSFAMYKQRDVYSIQQDRMIRYITMIEYYEHAYEQVEDKPVRFLRFIKNVRLPQIQDTPHLPQHCQLSLAQEINVEDLIELLSEIEIAEGGKRPPLKERLRKLMPSHALPKSLKEMDDYEPSLYFTRVKPEMEDVREKDKLTLTRHHNR